MTIKKEIEKKCKHSFVYLRSETAYFDIPEETVSINVFVCTKCGGIKYMIETEIK